MPTENSVITREHLPGLLLARTIWENGGPSLYFPPALQDATDQARAALPAPASVPDGYMPIPTAEQIADALDNVRCFHDMSAELIAPRLLANLLAALGSQTPRKSPDLRDEVERMVRALEDGEWAEHAGQTELGARLESAITTLINRLQAPSLPAAVSADLTAVRCQCCATEYPHDSYDAGFIAGSGMCQVCDAAIPAVDLPSAAPAEQPYPHGIAEDLERSDWAPLEALQWYAAGNHFDVADGRTRIIDTGAVASNALKHASLAYLELKGDAELSELRSALSAQQSAQPEFCCELSYKAAKQKAWNARRIDRCKCDHNEYCDHCWPADFRPGGKWHGKFVAQQSTHVSVPRELLEDLVVHIEDNTCTHENTYRGGAIWEICDDCGDKWADDRGGKPAFKWPDCVEKARALLNGGEA